MEPRRRDACRRQLLSTAWMERAPSLPVRGDGAKEAIAAFTAAGTRHGAATEACWRERCPQGCRTPGASPPAQAAEEEIRTRRASPCSIGPLWPATGDCRRAIELRSDHRMAPSGIAGAGVTHSQSRGCPPGAPAPRAESGAECSPSRAHGPACVARDLLGGRVTSVSLQTCPPPPLRLCVLCGKRTCVKAPSAPSRKRRFCRAIEPGIHHRDRGTGGRRNYFEARSGVAPFCRFPRFPPNVRNTQSRIRCGVVFFAYF